MDENLKETFKRLQTIVLSNQKLRNWFDDFLPVNSLAKRFKYSNLIKFPNKAKYENRNAPSVCVNWELLEKRLTTNLVYYRTNYLVVFLLIAAATLFQNPFLLFIIVFAMIGSVFFLSRDDSQDKTKIPQQQKFMICSIGTVALLYLTGTIISILIALLIFLILLIIHASLRTRHFRSKSALLSSEFQFSIGMSQLKFFSNKAAFVGNDDDADDEDKQTASQGDDENPLRRRR